MIFEIADLDAKLEAWADLVSSCNISHFYENLTISGINDLDQKSKICKIWSQN